METTARRIRLILAQRVISSLAISINEVRDALIESWSVLAEHCRANNRHVQSSLSCRDSLNSRIPLATIKEPTEMWLITKKKTEPVGFLPVRNFLEDE
jgi:hypothetical protein